MERRSLAWHPAAASLTGAGLLAGGQPLGGREHPTGHRAALRGLQEGSELSPWAQPLPTAPVTWGAWGGGQSCRDRRARNTRTHRKALLGTLKPLDRTRHFLHLPPAPGAPARPGSPWDAAPISIPVPVYIYKQPRAGAACSRGTGGTESQGQRCSARRAVTPHGWEGAHAEAWGRQSPSQQLLLRRQAKANGGKATPGAVPNPLRSAWCWGSAGHLPALSAPALGGGTARWLAGRGVAGDIAPTPPGAHATGRACWAFTW